MTNENLANYSTVSFELIDDLLKALKKYCSNEEVKEFLKRAGLELGKNIYSSRVTLDHIVRLYKIAAMETEDEMMGLWNRPVRTGALNHLITTIKEANSLPSAIYRFSTFWNLILDDYQLKIKSEANNLSLNLLPLKNEPVQRFGHMLILKLCHGLMSWLADKEIPLEAIDFAFKQPDFAKDYSFIFPAPVSFDKPVSSISFDVTKIGRPIYRNNADILEFLQRAPRDWIFTKYTEHTFIIKIRDFIYDSHWSNCNLNAVAKAFYMTPRTLLRKLEIDNSSFQTIKDEMRRDMAIRYLRDGRKSVEEISFDLGYSKSSSFYRAFKKWTGESPNSYR